MHLKFGFLAYCYPLVLIIHKAAARALTVGGGVLTGPQVSRQIQFERNLSGKHEYTIKTPAVNVVEAALIIQVIYPVFLSIYGIVTGARHLYFIISC